MCGIYDNIVRWNQDMYLLSVTKDQKEGMILFGEYFQSLLIHSFIHSFFH